MEDVRKQLQSVDQARSGAGEVGRGVHGHHTPGADAGQCVGVLGSLQVGSWCVIAAGHHHHDLWEAAITASQDTVIECSPGKPS